MMVAITGSAFTFSESRLHSSQIQPSRIKSVPPFHHPQLAAHVAVLPYYRIIPNRIAVQPQYTVMRAIQMRSAKLLHYIMISEDLILLRTVSGLVLSHSHT